MTVIGGEESPVYLRLRGMISAMILDGTYAEGDQLPSVRVFASEHGANPLTVAKAYQSLQDKGYVTVKRGIGMFVAEGAIDQLRVDERAQFLTEFWPKIRQHIARLGIEPAELLDRIDA
ncbi:GntR family transcriptional regulator [Sphingomonas sp. LaA6.9]|uniref:GntR family transcriptional regulator n=1 Tax=Sphingomonas sp. LaA6.9 TaxID=2919914 RepID=UPI001F4FBFB4|nr:GntR family transcriptional regulator [Sphingomonas sp. LaA6.9]MCJ8158408.1 GntR family transcriptional regulator [Sphingomonas sp. LaA6.9]